MARVRGLFSGPSGGEECVVGLITFARSRGWKKGLQKVIVGRMGSNGSNY